MGSLPLIYLLIRLYLHGLTDTCFVTLSDIIYFIGPIVPVRLMGAISG
jgi:hypothetical protein